MKLFWETYAEGRELKSRWSQTNDLLNLFLSLTTFARRQALLGYGREWLDQYQDNTGEWESGSWCTVTSQYPS